MQFSLASGTLADPYIRNLNLLLKVVAARVWMPDFHQLPSFMMLIKFCCFFYVSFQLFQIEIQSLIVVDYHQLLSGSSIAQIESFLL